MNSVALDPKALVCIQCLQYLDISQPQVNSKTEQALEGPPLLVGDLVS